MSKIKALINPVTPFAQNAPIIFCDETKHCAFVDPGGDIDVLLNIAKENNLVPKMIVIMLAVLVNLQEYFRYQLLDHTKKMIFYFHL